MASRLRQVFRTKEVEDHVETGGKSYGPLSNKDLEPTPPVQRDWSPRE
jgi:hypothetical protein